jgi:hypothetical protein
MQLVFRSLSSFPISRAIFRAIGEVKTLSGLLPISSNCKKIRDEKGYYQQIELYVMGHSEAEFSHRVCPECITALYPDFKRKA